MLAAQGIRLPLSVVVAAYLNGQFYGQITVGRVGEFYRAEALVERRISIGRAMSSCLWDRILDVIAVLSLAAVLGAFVVGDRRSAVWAGGMLAALAAGGVVALGVVKSAFNPKHPTERSKRLREKIERSAPLKRLVRGLLDLVDGAKELIRPLPLLEALFWTGISWANYYATLWQLAGSMGLTASRASLTAASSLAALTALLPISISGLGVREAVFAQVLGTGGTRMESAVVLSLANLAVMTVAALSLGLIGVIWRHRQQQKSAQAL
jgi:uncharacterized protein (TIRG00374 family)